MSMASPTARSSLARVAATRAGLSPSIQRRRRFFGQRISPAELKARPSCATASSTLVARTELSTRCAPRTARCSGPTRPAALLRVALPMRTASSSSAITPAPFTGSAPRTARRSGRLAVAARSARSERASRQAAAPPPRPIQTSLGLPRQSYQSPATVARTSSRQSPC